MNPRSVKAMSDVARKLADIKKILGDALSESHPTKYMEIRELLNDCQSIMAEHCDCAPIKLISGDVDDIVYNYEVSRIISKVVQ